MSVTPRAALAAAPLAAAATLPDSAVAQKRNSTPTNGTGRQAPGFYRYKVGEIEVTAINDGFFTRSPEGLIRNAGLPEVQEALREAFLPTNEIAVPFTTLVLDHGGRLTLIDTGNGDAGAPTAGTWMANFRAAGFDPARVNSVIVSHFHGDHINGLRLKDGTAVFPNAEVMVPAVEWDFWMDDARMAEAPIAANVQNVRRVFGPMARDVNRYEANKEIVPGVTTIAAPGHTPGHTAYMLASGIGRLMVMSDTANHPALFVRNPDWSAIFDMDADQARQTRHRLLDMAAAERSQVAFYHAPFPATGHIAKEGARFRLVPVQWTTSL